jgi:ComF family protein
MQLVKDIWNAFTDIIYPRVCPACEQGLGLDEKELCLSCRLNLPVTDYHTFPDNPVARHFWGKVPLEAATALYHFHKDGKVQHLLHQLKYKNRKDIGLLLGKLLAESLREHPVFSTCDLITSVPLHPRKEARRGYNQSHLIALGISESLGIPCLKDALQRNTFTATQTKKGRLERWNNVDGKFILKGADRIQDKHILLIDDVVTTGATLEVCAQTLLLVPGTKVSVAAVAHAEI